MSWRMLGILLNRSIRRSMWPPHAKLDLLDIAELRAAAMQQPVVVVRAQPFFEKGRRHRKMSRRILDTLKFDASKPALENIVPEFSPEPASGAVPFFLQGPRVVFVVFFFHLCAP